LSLAIGPLLGLSVGVIAAATVVDAAGVLVCKHCGAPVYDHKRASKHLLVRHPDRYQSRQPKIHRQHKRNPDLRWRI
jgi:hypothetical protein